MDVELALDAEIRTAPCPKCALCGNDGVYAYIGQRDRLFGAPGLWNFKQCCNRDCGLIWLDPMPLNEDIAKAYASYYTHTVRNSTGSKGPLKVMFRRMKSGYWASRYDYRIGCSVPMKMFGLLLYLFPLRRRSVDEEVRLLPALVQGRLLDVGCGSGEWLTLMKSLGWHVEGIDFDKDAVEIARQSGLNVFCGSLEEHSFANCTFDAVTLNHVIEHVPDPIRTLTECERILKPGGKLVLFTPNVRSLSHRVFGQDWRGLEPPRHLHLFSPKSLVSLLELAGFQGVSIRPQIAESVIYDSVLLRRRAIARTQRRNWSASLAARLFNAAELCAVKWRPSLADCVAAIALKEATGLVKNRA